MPTSTAPGGSHERIRAGGRTLRGSRFTREQAVTALVMRPGGETPGKGRGEVGEIERLLRCLADDERLRDWVRERGIDPERLLHCLADEDGNEERQQRG